ncbi:DUF3192 domain-containing protein [Idiomarina loihiensis]|jgi:hypothetical protein|uniref:SmpA /OmlA family lipoprotein n=1 Tax=Idiomarina loihiensis (strain ATCC BAA-735 / DSM 15497 / L2-TR) TaxID=283942 RepID=Q5QW11_IDILO|nr:MULTISPECIES: DUF3192 domain-containing protein [Idiomarina]AAV81699.1 SmpA /OmlA family lipoprotein [Idiomarina loihiensis L2TR]AGM35728.1 SmpA /OmlA family lipoprotein [Idiomarina loihiensis GSL 199]MAA62936.1 DUF3192 domain-containing protein [Idiomarina sp.]MBL4856393.1 DUF3192 domain-containing protein [Idiomarina sp.]MRJ43680.1 DUF3192 domain-containing protein [Idiomarina loihiensis]|tara:strand:- start:138 stop:524 length:387 start_codon:yes stop_codon:yes gene_type:complete
MKNKVFVILAIGAVSYLAIVGAVLMLYQADPADLQWQERETYNARQIGQFDLGMSKDSVIRVLGSPDITEAKASSEGDMQVLFYRTHHVTSDGITTKDECTPLVFRDNKLIAWGNDSYRDYQNYQRRE